jgi:radical SAM superfamily enzyme YgiQ (UPF0313 family)
MVKVGLYQANYRMLDSGWTYLPPLSLGYISAYVKKYVDGVEFILERDLDALIAHKPDLVCITYVTHSARHAGRMARRVKEALGCPVLGGGAHVSTLPTTLEEGFDLGCVGEGEETFADLIRLYQSTGRFDPVDLAKVPGIIYRDGDGILQKSGKRPFIQDLDSIPHPDRSIFGDKWNKPQLEWQMMTTRGCPYDCSFCSVIVQWGQRYRCHSEEYVIDELEQLVESGPARVVHFYDDLFTVKRQRVLKILSMMRERGLHEGRQFTCFVRSNLIDEEMMEAFASTHFNILNVGFESGSDEVLELMNKQAADLSRHREAVDLARKYGVRFSSCFILGSEGEKRDDIVKTFQFVRESADVFHEVHFTPLMVFPGTPVWEQAKKCGVSEEQLDGVCLDEIDFEDGMDFLKNRWPYLNEANIPRDEMIGLLQLADIFAETVKADNGAVRGLRDAVSQRSSVNYIAENVPLIDIIRAKTRRRVTRFMPGY